MIISKFRNITSCKIISYVIIQILLIMPLNSVYAAVFYNDKSSVSFQTLSPKIMLNSGGLYDFINSTMDAQEKVSIFGLPKNAEQELLGQINQLNALFLRHTPDQVIDIVLADPELEATVSKIIRAQDRMEDTGGLSVNREWAEEFKQRSLKRAVDELEGRDIFFLQMEYELSKTFLEKFKQHLIEKYLMIDDGTPYEERLERANQQAVYATGQLAKLQMAGGLGSFKPDWVRGFYDDLKKFWGAKETSSRLHVMGIFYAKAIKGEGELVRDKELDPIFEKIRTVKGIKNNVQQRVEGESELVNVALENMNKIVTYNIPVNMNGFGNVDVTVYGDPYSRLHEYWMYCPEIFHEAYPGTSDDEFRAVQTFVYREVLVRYIEYLARKGETGKKIIITDSETSTALAAPEIMDKTLEIYPEEKREQYKEIFRQLEDFDILYHHYNHTIVPAGMGTFPAWKFSDLKVSKEFTFIKQQGRLDTRMLVGESHDIISGCSTAHTKVMRDNPDLYKHFSYKIREDDLFGNSEGSDVDRWQGEPIKQIINIYMQDLKVETADALFRTLEKNPGKKDRFIQEVRTAKKIQKQHFIEELFKGTFGDLDVTRGELEKDGVNLLNRPFFTFVRRMVPYKCSNFIVDRLENEQDRERIIKSGAVILIGGRKFDGFAELQHRRIQKLIEQDPRLRSSIIFISNHNVSTSWQIQQGTDFGGMLSWEDMEAGPTSPSNAGLNWTNLFSSPDGVMIERVRKIKRDDKGNVISGTGHIIEYGQDRADNALKSRLPDKESFLSEMEAGCKNYQNGRDFDLVAFNNMWLQMTQGDIRTQAAGTLRMWAKFLEGQKADNAEVNSVMDEFISHQKQADMQQMLYDGEGDIDSFWFGKDFPQERADSPGLDHFYQALKYNTEQGFIYSNPIDFLDYMKGTLKNKTGNKDLIDIFRHISGSKKHFSVLTPYEKQKVFLDVLNLLISKLKNKIDDDGKFSPRQAENIAQVEASI